MPERPTIDWTMWASENVSLTRDNGNKVNELALVKGPLAVHPVIADGPKDKDLKGFWAVSHVPTGLRLVVQKTTEDALSVAETLLIAVGDLLWERPPVLLEKFPPHVKAWVLDCTRKKEYISLQKGNQTNEAFKP